MKFAPLSSIAIAMIFALSPVSMATPTSDNTLNSTVTQPFVLPPIIPSRILMPKNLPNIDLFAERDAIKNNGALPENVDQKGGMGLNSTTSRLAISRGANVYATAEKIQELKTYNELIASSYCRSVVPGSKWKCKHCSPDETLVSTFDSSKHDTNGYIARNDRSKVINLVFRGTSSIPNFIDDFDFSAQDYPPVTGTKIHTGFYKTYLEVQKHVLSVMMKEITAHPRYHVVVSGHSLGGALAIIGALDLFQHDSRFNAKNLSIKTYGGPRVGNPAFAYYVTGTGISLERIVNKHDIVPHVPPQFFGFLHPGTEYWIRGGDNVKICDDALDSSKCSNSIVPFTKLLDHISYFDINTGLCL